MGFLNKILGRGKEAGPVVSVETAEVTKLESYELTGEGKGIYDGQTEILIRKAQEKVEDEELRKELSQIGEDLLGFKPEMSEKRAKAVRDLGHVLYVVPEAASISALLAPHFTTHPDRDVRWAVLWHIIPKMGYDKDRLDLLEEQLDLLDRIRTRDPDKEIRTEAEKCYNLVK